MKKNTNSLLINWVKDVSSIKTDPAINITYSPECGYGLELKDFKGAPNTDEELAVVTTPDDLVLNASKIKQLASKDPILQSWIQVDSCSGSNLLHRGLLYYWLFKDSKWKPYLESLPTDIDLPFNYSIKKMESLDFSTISLNYAALSKRLSIERSYERFVRSNVQHSKSITLKQWLLPHQWISSRGLTHPVTGETCIVPLIDLCNHSSSMSNSRYDIDKEGNFQLLLLPHQTASSFPATFDLLIDYGNRSSSEFMFNYGFIPKDRTADDFDEIIRFFDPSSDEIRDILDPGRTTTNASEEERFAWSLAYDVLLEFFSDNIPQKLRLVVLPKSVEQNEKKRYRFNNNFVVALASDDHLELRNENNKRVLFFDNIVLEPETVFKTVQSLKDDNIMQIAREITAKLCRVFHDKLMHVSDTDKQIYELAQLEARIYKRFADSVEC